MVLFKLQERFILILQVLESILLFVTLKIFFYWASHMYIILVGKNNELNQQIQYYSLKKENSNEWSHSNVFFFFLPKRKRITLRNTCKWVDPWGSGCALHVEWWCWGHSSLEPIFKIRSVWHQRPLVSRRPDNTIFFFLII